MDPRHKGIIRFESQMSDLVREIVSFWGFFFSCTHSMWKFPGQGYHLSHSSDNTGSLTHCATRELLVRRNEKKEEKKL